METQWYCPPDVGAIEASSARDAAVMRAPIQQKRKPYIKVTGPPLSIAVVLEMRLASHVASVAAVKDRRVTKLNRR